MDLLINKNKIIVLPNNLVKITEEGYLYKIKNNREEIKDIKRLIFMRKKHKD